MRQNEWNCVVKRGGSVCVCLQSEIQPAAERQCVDLQLFKGVPLVGRLIV